ncbi:peptidoglycan-binding domain-containing protein [Anoxynatronum sibiricum]|uniref:Peptidoglycan-binding domain-containing protein n=1 Tax=Anoxynatronum sibiricum TaxID=210623 RepID=A0ABU9VQY9_9CLOT
MSMNQQIKRVGVITVLIMALWLPLQADAFTENSLLKREMSGQEVQELQQHLQALGFFTTEPTGYFGQVTESAVAAFQEQHGLTSDGIAGAKTLSMITTFVQSPEQMAEVAVTRGSGSRVNANSQTEIKALSWFGEVEHLFARGDVATIVDVWTGLSYQVKRTYGTNHADVETLTKEDTAIFKKVAGGEWNWSRRPVIVEVHGLRIAASIASMPHAGRDDLPALQTVNNRSGGFGKGTNLDEVKGNNMHGHVDLHFVGSKGHSSGRVDADHQKAIQEALNATL